MARSTDEWIGKTDDEAIPPRVRVRVFQRYNGVCQECGNKIITRAWICDHRIAIINGGENRENNLGPIHEACDKTKTKADVALKSANYKKTAKRLGVKLKKSRPIPGSKASGWKRKINGTIERR